MIRLIAIKGYGIGANCKITTYSDNRVTYSFGNGRNNYCLTASYDPANPDNIYIDRVEKAECLIDVNIEDIEDATAKLVRLALYTMYQDKPSIKRITLKDDSYLYCNGSSGPKISIAYDYILKYNQTWYQKKFGALLPGFISENGEMIENTKLIKISIDDSPKMVHVIDGSPMDIYLTSILNLDKPCITYEEITDNFYEIKRHRNEYELSASPRDFIEKLRKKYDIVTFCKEGATWFKRYIEFLQVKLFYDLWYIPVSSIKMPTGFVITEPSAKNKSRILQGGKRNRTKKSSIQYGIISNRDNNGLGLTWKDIV
jgi:hypothetical protein